MAIKSFLFIVAIILIASETGATFHKKDKIKEKEEKGCSADYDIPSPYIPSSYPLPYMQPPKYGYPLPPLPHYPEQRAGVVQPEYKLAYVIEYKPTYPEHPPTIDYTSTYPEPPSANPQQHPTY